MSMPELGHRVAEQTARLSGRRFNREWAETSAEGNIAELPFIRGAWSEMPEALKVRVAKQARKTIS
jgi:hypothetical protein